MSSEALISSLASGLAPVQRLPRPEIQAVRWLVVALVTAGLAAMTQSLVLTGKFAPHLGAAVNSWQFLASLATGATAALAAAMLAHPDRSGRWALMPLVPLAGWLAVLGWGCAADLARIGTAALTPGLDWPCAVVILLVGLPLAVVQYRALRHGGAVRPVAVLMLGGLASAALCSAASSLVHPVDAAMTILAWHGIGAGLVLLFGWLSGRRLLLHPLYAA